MLIEMSDTIFGKNILFLRKKYQLSRKTLSCLTGINVYKLKDWEEGKASAILTFKQLKRISAVFDIPTEQLVNFDLEEIATSGFQPSSQ